VSKDNFKTRVFTKTNYAPPTGVGRFDAKFDVPNQDLLITVRVFLNFMDMQEDQKGPFRDAFRLKVPPVWGSQFKFRSTKPGWTEFEAIPRFKLVFQDDYPNSHFIVNVKPSFSGKELVSRDDAYLARHDVGYKPKSANIGGLLATERVDMSKSIGASLKAAFPFAVQCALTSGVSSPYTRTQIKTLAKELARVDANFPLFLKAGGSDARGNMAAVQQLLREGGLKGPITQRKRAFKYKNQVVITMKDDIEVAMSNVADKSKFGYDSTVAHEFGHMLGLQDEYSCMSANCSTAMKDMSVIKASEQAAYESRGFSGAAAPTGNAAAGQSAWVNLCTEAKVSPPTFGFHSTSVMSAGSVFHKRHFVMLWDCLGTMCEAFVARTEWEIVKDS